MFAITCDLTGATGYAGCACPDGHDANPFGHHPNECQLSDLHAIPGCVAGCCDQHGQDDHDHDPQECLVEHPAGSCPTPASCKLWRNVGPTTRTRTRRACRSSAPAATTVTVTWSTGSAPSFWQFDGQEFAVTSGAWALDVQSFIDFNSSNNAYASLTPAAACELYYAEVAASSTRDLVSEQRI